MAGRGVAASALKLVSNSSAGPKKLLLGKCYPCYVPKATKVYVKRMDWDDFLKWYFPRFDTFFAHDPEGVTKTGDIVLIEEFPKRLTRDITHKVLKILYPLGDVVDPIRGKKCMGGELREDEQWKDELWGRNENAFDYEKAPPRGWQEGRKDWSHKPAQRKFHEFNDRDTTHMEY
jgi:small subunit ribosomal protein S17